MTHTSTEQPEALMRLADSYAEACFDQGLNQRTTDDKPETEREKLEKAIRRMHTHISELEAQLSAIGAGGGWMPPAVRELIDRLQDAQQDINLAANTHMSQQLASAAALLDEVESTLRTLITATQPVAQRMDARDAAFEAVRKAFCNLQRYSFLLDSRGNVRRCADHSGNWVEFEAAHTLFEPQSVDAALAAQAKQGERP